MGEWRRIITEPDCKNVFEVSDDGQIKKNGEIKKGTKSAKGFVRIKVGRRNKDVHRLVADAFIPNPDSLEFVRHKDGNKENNKLENLYRIGRQTKRTPTSKETFVTAGGETLVRSFRPLIAMYKNKELAQSLVCTVPTVTTMRYHDYVPQKYWKAFIAALRLDQGLSLCLQDFETITQEPFRRKEFKKPADYIDWYAMRHEIFRFILWKTRVSQEKAEEAADHALLVMMENGVTANPYGCRVAVLFLYEKWRNKSKRSYVDINDVYFDDRLIQWPAQESALLLSEAFEAANYLPSRLKETFVSCVLGENNDELNRRLNIVRGASSYRSQMRRVLRLIIQERTEERQERLKYQAKIALQREKRTLPTGVSFCGKRNRYEVSGSKNNKTIYLGRFKTLGEATDAREAFDREKRMADPVLRYKAQLEMEAA